MVEADRADRVEAAQVVLVWRVVAVPADDVQRRVIDARRPQSALELRDQFEIAVDILERRDRRKKVARVRQAIRTDRPGLPAGRLRSLV